MASNDDVLDNLIADDADDIIDLDEASEMSLEDIDRILEKNQKIKDEVPNGSSLSDADLMDILNDDGGDLSDIRDLLDKNARDEAVAPEIAELLKEDEDLSEDELLQKIENGEQIGTKAKEVKKPFAGNPFAKLFGKKEKKEKDKTKEITDKKEKTDKKNKKEKKVKEDKIKEVKKSKDKASKTTRTVMPTAKNKTEPDLSEVDNLFADMDAQFAAEDSFKAEENTNPVNENASPDETNNYSELPEETMELSDLLGGDNGQEMSIDMDDIGAALREKGSDPVPTKKPKTEEKQEDAPEQKVKKKGLLSKIIEALTAEEEEEPEQNELILSKENEDILKEMEDLPEKKGKKGKKAKKGKKGKATEEAEDGDEGEDTGKKKGKKEKKPKKPKVKPVEEPTKKLSKPKVIAVFMLCISFGAAILVLGYVSNEFTDKRNAVKAYNDGDYKTCYQNLNGKHLTENEKIMYGKSESIMRIRLWIREYEVYADEGDEDLALDSLITSVKDYPTLFDYSSQWNANNEVSAVYNEILFILSDKYHLSEDQAKEIAFEKDDIEYSRMIYAIVSGKEFGSWKNEQIKQEQPLEDLLQEETELTNQNFIDNK